VDPIVKSSLYEQVIERIAAYCRESKLGAGDSLPSERLLAEQLGVSRATIKQALVVLQVQGLVDMRHGRRTVLRTAALSSEPISTLLDRRERLPAILEAREAVEPQLTKLAALRRTDADLRAMEDALRVMADELARGEIGEDGNRRFHTALAEAAHSPVLGSFLRTIDEDLGQARRESLRQPGRPELSFEQHQEILRAVEAQDPTGAQSAMRSHLATVRRLRLLDWHGTVDSDGH
jgi:GntR family transcriptional repressor for pyruvate dehydrogenase complex